MLILSMQIKTYNLETFQGWRKVCREVADVVDYNTCQYTQ